MTAPLKLSQDQIAFYAVIAMFNWYSLLRVELPGVRRNRAAGK